MTTLHATRQGAPAASTAVVALSAARVDGARGAVFGPITAASDRPITVVHGPRGSGRTSLLLAIAGRMRLSSGECRTLGTTSLGEVRRRTGVAGFDAIDALEPAVTVGDLVRERLSWALPWYRRTPRITAELAADLLEPAFGQRPIPDLATNGYDLEPAAEQLLRIGLALLEEPELLVIDDFDALRDPADRDIVAARLAELSRRGVRSVIATSDPGDIERFAELAPAVIAL
ncbi:ATP-binding cassette domain-containing protein [Leucobacter luti]|uniref:ABC transporter family protein n=1 Tax=Leucobacter luti TaxID=340320 RepID=A0A4V6MC05_9MICO|nr:ATP-binding cassette domain-containing protein [Leucobacter luti]RZT62889.1 ABC transporter family protein [Leucobacter luti]